MIWGEEGKGKEKKGAVGLLKGFDLRSLKRP